jgi:hypothetical protein
MNSSLLPTTEAKCHCGFVQYDNLFDLYFMLGKPKFSERGRNRLHQCCGSGKRIFPSRIQGLKGTESGSAMKSKNLSILSKNDPGCLSRIFNFSHPGSVFRIRIPDPRAKKALVPDPQHWFAPSLTLQRLVSQLITVIIQLKRLFICRSVAP